MLTSSKRVVWLAGLVVCVLLTSGCSEGEPWRQDGSEGAAGVVNEFFDAAASGDAGRGCARLEPEAQRVLAREVKAKDCLEALATYSAQSFDFGNVSVQADAVTIPGRLISDPVSGPANGTVYTGSAADVTLPKGLGVPGLSLDQSMVVVHTEAGWSISVPD